MFKKLREKLTNLELYWILYDVGNSAFTMLACSLVTVWFKALATENGLPADVQTAYWAYVASIVTVIVAFIGPVCGTIADNKGFKKPIFVISLIIGVTCCVLTGLVKSWFAFLVIFILAKVAYSSSLVFYDSMLTDVTTPERMDEVSSHGYAWGYIGSCIPFGICLVAYLMGESGKISQDTAKIIGFAVTGIWWLMVSMPLIFTYKQKYFVVPQRGAIKECFSRLGNTLADIIKYNRKVLLFLIAFFLYIDGVDTIIDNAVNIGTDLGLGDVGLIIMLLATQVVAFAFALVFSKLSKKYDTAKLIGVCILGYFAVSIYALFLKTLWQFGIMAFGVGMFQGAIQALSRSYYGKIIPAENSGEYFGLYDIFSKGAAFLGSFLIGIVKTISGSINIAVGTLAIFFFLGFILLKAADKAENLPNE